MWYLTHDIYNTQHILECEKLLGSNEIVTYIPYYEDLFGNEEEEQVYTSRIVADNLKRLVWGNTASKAQVILLGLARICYTTTDCIVLDQNNKISLVRETKHLSTVADSSTNTKKILLKRQNLPKKKTIFFLRGNFTPFMSKNFQI